MNKGLLLLFSLLFINIISISAKSTLNCQALGYSGNFSFSKSMVPEPVLENDSSFVELYYKAWGLAFLHIKHTAGLPQTPYMDEAFRDDTIWLWDTAFMLMFCKYAPDVFPGIQSFNNFYKPIHDSVQIPLRIEIPDNPPLFSWIEFEYFKFTNDKRHVKDLLYKTRYLEKHFNWFEKCKPGLVIANSAPTWLNKDKIGYFWEGGRSGMDNSPRGRTTTNAKRQRPNNPKMLWIDAIAQQGLSALYIARLYQSMGDKKEHDKWINKYNLIRDDVNRYYWNHEDGIYYDIDSETHKPYKVKTPASFWPLLAEMCSNDQAKRLISHVKDSSVFGGAVPWTSLARNDNDFSENGNYWRGSVWLPLAYMGIKSLEKYNYYDLATDNAYAIISHMDKTYRTYSPHTIWECYNPVLPKPAINEHGTIARADFCGWSALGPISLLIENVLGFYKIDAQQNEVYWHKSRTDKHGIRKLTFGNVVTDIIAIGNTITVTANRPYVLFVNNQKVVVKKGVNVKYIIK